jgi:hypothetical protein
MFSGFLKGLLTGGILGTLLSNNYFLGPQKKRMDVKKLKGKTKILQSKASKVMKSVIKDVNDLLK